MKNFIIGMLMPVACFAAEAADLGFMDKIIEFLKSASTSSILVGVAMMVEMVLRLIKSEKPLSILHLISAAMKKVAEICKMGAELLDKVLPQNTKPQA